MGTVTSQYRIGLSETWELYRSCKCKIYFIHQSVEYLFNKTFQIEVHKRAMSISAPSVEGHNLLGFALALNSNYSDAADEFQAAKSFDRHNQFAEEMLKHVMTEIAKECS